MDKAICRIFAQAKHWAHYNIKAQTKSDQRALKLEPKLETHRAWEFQNCKNYEDVLIVRGWN